MNNRGFTLVEVLSVVIIIGVLTAVAVPQYQNAIKKSRAAEAQVMLKSLYDSSERLAAEFGYDDYSQLRASGVSNIGIARLDMFGSAEGGTALPAGYSLSGEILSGPSFDYKLVSASGGRYLAAQSKNGNFDGSLILFDRDTHSLYCQAANPNVEDNACDVWGMETTRGKSF